MTTYLDYTLQLRAVSLSPSLWDSISFSEPSWGRRRLLAWSKPVFKLKKGANVQRACNKRVHQAAPLLLPSLSLSVSLSISLSLSLAHLAWAVRLCGFIALNYCYLLFLYSFDEMLSNMLTKCRICKLFNCVSRGVMWSPAQDMLLCLALSPSLSRRPSLAALRLIIDRLQLEALSEIIIIRLNAWPTSCYGSYCASIL